MSDQPKPLLAIDCLVAVHDALRDALPVTSDPKLILKSEGGDEDAIRVSFGGHWWRIRAEDIGPVEAQSPDLAGV